ncbi:MAG: hypothetical protein AB7S78_11945 [Candidatus Omnitrophota bacterium]
MSNRLVVHDTFFRFYMQYYYLNTYVNYLEFPFWIPYLTHGTLATPWQGLVGIHGIFNNTLFLTGNILKYVNFLPIFYMGVFFDRLVLLLGTWYFSKRLYNSPLVSFFVTTSILISSVWASQIHLNFLFYYAIPLIIYLFHRFLETQKWRYCFLALNLFSLQCVDKLFYFLPVVSLTISLYFFFYALLNFQEVSSHIKKIKFNLNGIFCLALVLTSALVVFYLVKIGMAGDIVKNVFQRNEDGSVNLNIFLTYSQDNSLTKWAELLLGLSIKNDTTLYCGLLIPLMALFALSFNLNRKSLPLILTGFTLFLFSLGSIVSIFFYHSWPTMKFYRHIFQIVSIVRLFLCLFSGFGFLKLFEFIFSQTRSRLECIWLATTSLGVLIAGLIFFNQAGNSTYIVEFIKPLTYDTDLNLLAGNSSHYYSYFRFLGIKYILCSLLVSSLLFLNRPSRKWVVFLLIIFHLLDGYIYTLKEFNNRTVAISPKQLSLTQFQPIIYNNRRSQDEFSLFNSRFDLLTPELLSKSMLSWNIHALMFNDPFYSQLRTDHWLKPYDQYTTIDPLGLKNATKKKSGITENKIQFFRQAYCSDSTKTSRVMALPENDGNNLFLECLPDEPPTNLLSKDWEVQSALRSNDRLSLSPIINFFSSNRIEIEVYNPSKQPIWLFYSDVWHPFWKVQVNHKDSPLYKADIAYKAVLLVPGTNKVLFYFSASTWRLLTFLIILNSFFWFCYIIYLLKSTIFQNDSEKAKKLHL